jgi:hypothetical protein
MKTSHLIQVVLLPVALSLAAITLGACGHIRPGGHPASTLTLPERGNCVRGYKTRQVASVGSYGTPVVEVTDIPCEAKP